jgi:hypothetical protein
MKKYFTRSLLLAVLLTRVTSAQSRDSANVVRAATQQSAVPACCRVVRVDAERSLVTARETATGYTFRFALKSRRVLDALKIGQPVWADFTAKTVKLKATDASPCCGIVEIKEDP